MTAPSFVQIHGKSLHLPLEFEQNEFPGLGRGVKVENNDEPRCSASTSSRALSQVLGLQQDLYTPPMRCLLRRHSQGGARPGPEEVGWACATSTRVRRSTRLYGKNWSEPECPNVQVRREEEAIRTNEYALTQTVLEIVLLALHVKRTFADLLERAHELLQPAVLEPDLGLRASGFESKYTAGCARLGSRRQTAVRDGPDVEREVVCAKDGLLEGSGEDVQERDGQRLERRARRCAVRDEQELRGVLSGAADPVTARRTHPLLGQRDLAPVLERPRAAAAAACRRGSGRRRVGHDEGEFDALVDGQHNALVRQRHGVARGVQHRKVQRHRGQEVQDAISSDHRHAAPKSGP